MWSRAITGSASRASPRGPDIRYAKSAIHGIVGSPRGYLEVSVFLLLIRRVFFRIVSRLERPDRENREDFDRSSEKAAVRMPRRAEARRGARFGLDLRIDVA